MDPKRNIKGLKLTLGKKEKKKITQNMKILHKNTTVSTAKFC